MSLSQDKTQKIAKSVKTPSFSCGNCEIERLVSKIGKIYMSVVPNKLSNV